MPICQKCHRKWNRQQTLKRMIVPGTFITCPFCCEHQYFSAKSRKKMVLISTGLPVIFPFLILFAAPFPCIALLSLCIAALQMFLLPAAVELSNKEEPLW